MSEIALTALSDASWLDPLQRAYLIWGDDDDLMAQATDAIKRRIIEDDLGEFDWERLDASRTGVEDMLASANRIPIASERRLVVVYEAQLYAKAERKNDAARLANGIRALPPASCLVLVAAGLGSGRSKSSALTPAIDKAVREVGATVKCSALDGPGLADWAARYARESGKELHKQAALRLVASGEDRVGLRHSLEKVIAYVGERKAIEVRDIDAVVGQAPEDVMFRLIDAVSGRRTSDALVLLRRASQFEAKAPALAAKFIALLNRQLRLLWQARELVADGVPTGRLKDAIASRGVDLPREASIASIAWKAPALARDSGKWSRAELAEAVRLLVECDAANKGEESGSADSMSNLEQLVVRLCTGR